LTGPHGLALVLGMATSDREHWNKQYGGTEVTGGPSEFLQSITELLPLSGVAIDIAGGSGADACWLAQRGLTVTLVEVSDVALELASKRASALGVELSTQQVDLEEDPIPGSPWSLVVLRNYLQRDLFGQIVGGLADGGILAVALATRTNLERNENPRAEFLLEPNELRELAGDLSVVEYSEGWTTEGRHEARLVARKF
jgi:tellurite methyltransferase